MSVTGSPSKIGDASSSVTDAIVLTVLAIVCFSGIVLTAPDKDVDTPVVEIVSSDVETMPEPATIIPDITPTVSDLTAPESTMPSVPAIKPPPDIEVPSIKPDPPITGITLRSLPEIHPDRLIASGRGFISLMGSNYDPTNWHRSTHKASSDFLATDWTTDHAVYDADGLALRIEPAPGRPNHFLGGEIQTRESYGYGRYEVLMRPAKASGTVSSFFTYTGPYHGNPHDEVDIEFLGQNTREVYLNYFRSGQVGEHVTLPLPFDASEALHLYAFEWRPDAITWFIDGEPVHITRPGDTKIPRTPGKIIVNLWSGKAKLRSWHGRPDFDAAVEAEYACISFQPLGGTGRSCSTIFPPEGTKAPISEPGLFVRAATGFLQRLIPQYSPTAQLN